MYRTDDDDDDDGRRTTTHFKSFQSIDVILRNFLSPINELWQINFLVSAIFYRVGPPTPRVWQKISIIGNMFVTFSIWPNYVYPQMKGMVETLREDTYWMLK
jgi:hypothetical protein